VTATADGILSKGRKSSFRFAFKIELSPTFLQRGISSCWNKSWSNSEQLADLELVPATRCGARENESMTLLACARCIAVHGAPGCPATLEDLDGKPSCCWCEDLEPCPVLQKQQRVSRKTPPEDPPPKADDAELAVPSSGTENKDTRDEENPMETKSQTTSTHPPAATRICKRPGCTTQLGPNNESGKCAAHFHWTEKGTEKRSSNGGNGHANGTNGHAHTASHDVVPKAGNGSNGTNGAAKKIETLPELAADRVDRLILSLPVADKTRLAVAWLTGAI
jgi:hypothetical protein